MNNAEQHKPNFALFISDLHLSTARTQISDAFIAFLNTTATQYEHLYILGDFFDYWAGDDDLASDFHQHIVSALKTLHTTGTQVYLMHGNRDFLIGEQFAKACNLTLLNDPHTIQYDHQAILLSHGDALCTDDTAYQAMRKQFRDPQWQQQFLSQPLTERKAQIAQIRMQSEQAKSEKEMEIMDVNNDAVAAMLRDYDYPAILIHGHTHRPNQHKILVDGHNITRWVLGDWYEQGSFLSLNHDGLSAHHL